MEIKYILLNKVSWKKDKTSHVFSQMDNDLKAELGLLKKWPEEGERTEGNRM